MSVFLFLVGVAVICGVAVYILFIRDDTPELPAAKLTPAPLPARVEEPATVVEPEPKTKSIAEPLVILDPLLGELLDDDSEPILVPLRIESEPGLRRKKKIHVNRKTAADYRRFGFSFFRDTLPLMGRLGYHIRYEEDDIVSTLDMNYLYGMMFGGDCTAELFEERCDELEAFYEEQFFFYGSVRRAVALDENMDLVTDEDVAEAELNAASATSVDEETSDDKLADDDPFVLAIESGLAEGGALVVEEETFVTGDTEDNADEDR